MAKTNDAGLKQLPNGNWSYRIYTRIDGKAIDTTCRQDDNGNPFKTKKAAKDARDAKIFELKHPKPRTDNGLRKAKLKEIWAEYLEGGASAKAEATLRKQHSMWDNHIEKKFGNRYADEITQAEIEDYLNLMYRNGDGGGKGESYSYKYVEGFLKFFYLLLARAYDSNCISTEAYTKMCMNRGTRISMPPITQEDNEKYKKIKIFTPLDIEKINLFLQGSNFHVSFMLGYMLGLRRSETFGLMWKDINWEAGTITVQRQMLYEDGCWVLRPVKTLNSVRVIDMGNDLQDYLFYFKQAQDERTAKLGHGWRDTEKVLDKTASTTKVIIGGDFINRKENGELMTVNTIKYWARELAKIGIEFKYHSLRRTHATLMAAANTPVIELQQRLGHRKFDTTMKYYIDTNMFAKEKLKQNIKGLTNFFIDGSMVISPERKKQLIDDGLLDKDEFVVPNIPLPSEKTIYGEMGFSSEAEFEETAEQKVKELARSVTEMVNQINKNIEEGKEDPEDY